MFLHKKSSRLGFSARRTFGFQKRKLTSEATSSVSSLTQPMANRLKLLGITYLVGKITFKQLFFHDPKWLSVPSGSCYALFLASFVQTENWTRHQVDGLPIPKGIQKVV